MTCTIQPTILEYYKTHCPGPQKCDCANNGQKCEDLDCVNRAGGVQCGIGSSSCGVKGCKNKELRKGIKNRGLLKHMEPNLGIGVKTTVDLCRDEMICEYVGSHKSWNQYRDEQCADPTRQLYSMKTVDGYVIDATDVDCNVKFINESCHPNCHAVVLFMDKIPRVVLKALRYIRAGEFLSYSYDMVALEGMKVYDCACNKMVCKNRKQSLKERHLKKFQCPSCPRAYAYRRGLKLHMRNKGHGNLNLFNCPMCTKSFNKRFQMEQHIHNLHQPHLVLHRIKVSEMKPTVPQKHKNAENVNTRKHNKWAIQQKNMPVRFTCHVCNRFRVGLDIHMMKHEEYVQTLQCKTCYKKFYKQTEMAAHIKTHPIQKNLKFKCTLCPKGFKSSELLKPHIEFHRKKEARKAACKICERVFDTKAFLEQHLRLCHPDNKLFSCAKCSRRFISSVSLKDHVTYYHSETRPKCATCMESFYDKNNLVKHMDRAHNHKTKEFVCYVMEFGCYRICKKIFSTRNRLNDHIYRYH